MNIGIIGYGKVGQSVGFIFEKNCKIYIVDPVSLGIRADRDWERISGAVITKAK